MKALLVLISGALFWLEWFTIRKTRLNRALPVAAALLVGLPLGALLGPHLVVWPLMLMLLAWLFCELEDRYFRCRGLTESEKTRLKDL